MPPLARNVVNTNAVNAVAEWVGHLPRGTEATAPGYRPASKGVGK
jgi:hypothetical protein